MFKLTTVIVSGFLLASCQPDKRPNIKRMLGIEPTQGSSGTAGANGTAGATGPSGVAGAAGASCTVTQLSDGAIIKCPDGSSAIITNGKDKANNDRNNDENDSDNNESN